MKTKLEVTIETNPTFKVLPMDGDTLDSVKEPTSKQIKAANDDYKDELHQEVVGHIKQIIEDFEDDDGLVEESYVEGFEDYEKDYGIKIKVRKVD